MYLLFGGVFVGAGIKGFLDSVIEEFVEILGFDVFVERDGSGGNSQRELDRVVYFKIVSLLDIEPRDIVASCIVGEDVVPSSPLMSIVTEASGLVGLCSPGSGLVSKVMPQVIVQAGAKGMDVVGVSIEIDRYQGGTFWMGLQLDEPIGDEVVSLLCSCVTMGATATSEGIHGHNVACVPRCKDTGIEGSSAFLDPLVEGWCFGLKWYNL